VVKSFLHRARRYPAFIVDGTTYRDREAADAAIAVRVSSTSTNGRRGESNRGDQSLS
jgi:hypothetical protein